MSDVFKFLDKEYTEASLKAMSVEDLLSLRNLIATNLGVASVRSFKDQEQAVEQTVKALTKFAEVAAEESAGAEPKAPKVKKAPKAPKEAVDRGPAKSAMPKTVKRPTREMFGTIRKVGEHDGTQGRQHRWTNYKDGMTIVDVIEGDGTEPWDVKNWVNHGIMAVDMPTDEQFNERKAAWYAKHGYTDPEVAKAQKEVEKAAAAEARAKLMAEKKAAAEAVKAAKLAAKQEAEPAPATA